MMMTLFSSHVPFLFVSLLALVALGNIACGQPPAPTQANVVYGTADDQKLLLDVYRPDAPGPHAAIVLIHGGGWAAGDKAGFAGLAQGLTLAGFVSFSVNYRLAPGFHYPAQVQDVARAVRWVRAHAREYDVDPARIGACANSAGGHLSLMLGVMAADAYQSPDDPNRDLDGRVRCVVDAYGPADFTDPARLPQAAWIVEGFLGAPYDQAPDKWAEASPITHVVRGAAPVLFIHGDKDTLIPLEQSELMKAALDKVGVPNELIIIANGDHGFAGADPNDVAAAFKRAADFLTQYLLTPRTRLPRHRPE
jgi:acetyl esterase/lipase